MSVATCECVWRRISSETVSVLAWAIWLGEDEYMVRDAFPPASIAAVDERLMSSTLLVWLSGDKRERVPVEWSWFQIVYGFVPPADFREWVECCGFGCLGSQWNLGVPVPTQADEVEGCREAVTLAVWIETDEGSDPEYVDFVSRVRESHLFSFGDDEANVGRHVGWRRLDYLEPERWEVVVVDFVTRTIDVVAESFLSFLAVWSKGVARRELYDLDKGSSPKDWRQANRELLYMRLAESNEALGLWSNNRPGEKS